MKNSSAQRSRWWFRMMDVMKMIDAFTTYLASFNKRFGSHNTRTQSYKDITLNAREVWSEEGYSCISITTCPCINTSYVLWLCLIVCFLLACVENCLFVCFTLNVFTLLFFFFFYQSFLAFVSKIQKHIKSRKSKMFDRHYYVSSQAYFALYLCTNGLVHLWV